MHTAYQVLPNRGTSISGPVALTRKPRNLFFEQRIVARFGKDRIDHHRHPEMIVGMFVSGAVKIAGTVLRIAGMRGMPVLVLLGEQIEAHLLGPFRIAFSRQSQTREPRDEGRGLPERPAYLVRSLWHALLHRRRRR